MRPWEAIGSVLALLLTFASVNAYRSNGGAVLLAESETELDSSTVSPNAVAAAGCPNACSDNGYCLESTCVCFEGFTGKDCLKRHCENGCNGHGVCEDGVCNCHVGWAGPDCGFQACVDDCNNGGFCRFEPRKPATCVCQPGRSGHACEKFDNGAEASQPCGLDNLCSNNGVCRNAQCACFSSFTGHDCSLMLCPDSCHGRGECNVNTGVCRCNEPFQPPNCALARCPGDCNGNGDCDKSNGKCTCKPGFYPPDCAQTNCKDNCHGNGKCIPVNSDAKQWKCECFEGWLNDTCGHEKPCLHGCSGHGMCDRGTCYCTAGWRGADCSKSSELAAGDASSSHSHRGCDPPCAANGVCLEHKTGWRCFCREGWTGLSCANADHGSNLHGFKLGSNPGKDEQGEGEAAKS